jgi:Putative prokaryotic signal transducing protein
VFCPTCGDEFRPGFDRCPDCDVALVPNPPQVKRAQDDDEFVTVATFENSLEAAAARGALESNGIPAVAPDENIGSFSRLGSTGWAELKVRRQDVAASTKLLRELGHS